MSVGREVDVEVNFKILMKNASQYERCEALLSAAAEGNVNSIRYLVEELGTNITASCASSWGETPLHLAALEGKNEVVRLLVTEYGALIESKDNCGSTPLHYAAIKGHVDTCRLLLGLARAQERVAEGRQQDEEGDGAQQKGSGGCATTTPCTANVRRHVEMRTDVSKLTPLLEAVAGGRMEVVRLLIYEYGADAYAVDHRGNTALHLACEHGHASLARFLIEELGLSVNALNYDGEAPIHRAPPSQHIDTYHVLSEHGADVCMKPPYGETPLLRATAIGDVQRCQLFLDMGADIEHASIEGETPFERAKRKEHEDIVRLFGNELFPAHAYGKTTRPPPTSTRSKRHSAKKTAPSTQNARKYKKSK